MKLNVRSILCLIIFIQASACSKKSNAELTQIIAITQDAEIKVPAGFMHERIPADDSLFGKITDPDDSTFVLIYDIGQLAGNYVDLDGSEKRKGASVNEDFCYEEVDKQYISSEDCCLYITFPDAGPANFISLKNRHFDLVLDIMETFTSK